MKKVAVLMAICILLTMIAGCSREGTSSGNATRIGPKSTCRDTVSATLTNSSAYPDGVELNWSKRVPDSQATLSGLTTISFVLNGDEKIDGLFKDYSLSSIELQFTSSSGKTETLSNSLLGNVTNIAADGSYFKVEDNTFKFYPHYFKVGEVVTVKTIFHYKGEGLANQLLDDKTAEGYFCFSVGEDTGETFPGIFEGWENPFAGNNNNGSSTTTDPTPLNFRVDGVEGEWEVSTLEEDALKNVISLPSATPTITFLTREEGLRNITKVYVIPVGYENTMQKIPWTNNWHTDNCHRFENLDLTAFSSQTITLRVEFLIGSELDPMPEHVFRFITLKVP